MYIFSVIRSKGEVDFLIGIFLKVYFPIALVIVAKICEKLFLRSFISKHALPLIASQIHKIQLNYFILSWLTLVWSSFS